MADIHCFEVSEVFELVDDLGQKWHEAMTGKDGLYKDGNVIEKTFAFLPAPKTWIEWRSETGRTGVLLSEVADMGFALCTVAQSDGARISSVGQQLAFPMHSREDFGLRVHPDFPGSRAQQITLLLRIYAMLALINSPKIIGRCTRPAHKALVKASAGMAPVHSWTELKLQVTKPVEIGDGQEHEPRLTGPRALHFCRAHARIRLGRLEYVSAHWRGNPSAGVRQKRYSLS
jgi:hypothetical protein